MTKQDAIFLFNSIHPGFFEQDDIKALPAEAVYAEMLLSLEKFQPDIYDKKMAENITFGRFQGTLEELREIVRKVDAQWPEFFEETEDVFCGYVNGEIASFCLVEDMGTYNLNGRSLKIGGPGCVGTLSQFRDKGVGLTMVKYATQILKDKGYDYSYIHFTGVASWYAKLGYEVLVEWNRDGVLKKSPPAV